MKGINFPLDRVLRIYAVQQIFVIEIKSSGSFLRAAPVYNE